MEKRLKFMSMHEFLKETALNRKEHNVKGWTLKNSYPQEDRTGARVEKR